MRNLAQTGLESQIEVEVLLGSFLYSTRQKLFVFPSFLVFPRGPHANDKREGVNHGHHADENQDATNPPSNQDDGEPVVK